MQLKSCPETHSGQLLNCMLGSWGNILAEIDFLVDFWLFFTKISQKIAFLRLLRGLEAPRTPTCNLKVARKPIPGNF